MRSDTGEFTPPPPPGPDLTRFRAEFPILERATYLNSCSLGALSLRSEERLRAFLDDWHALGASAWYGRWLDRVEELRRRVARFLGAGPDELALLPSTSAALSVVSESVDYERRNRVVTTELDFPTLLYQWAVKHDVEVVVLRSADGVGIDEAQFREAVDERTAFLATSHVFFRTGYVQDPARLASLAHEAGALCLVDGYQAAGQVPVSLDASGVDVYTTGPLKWLLGGPGLAYLYVRRDRIQTLEPRITGWFATEAQFAFDPEGFRYRPDARRFELGTPALATVHTALGGQEIMDQAGIDAVAARNRNLTARLVEACRAAGFRLRVSDAPERRSSIVMVAQEDPPGAVDYLARHDVVVDHRPGYVRVSPHFYNTPQEIDRCVTLLEETRG